MILLGWIVVFLLGVIVGILLGALAVLEDYGEIEAIDKAPYVMSAAEAAAYVQKRLAKSTRRPWVGTGKRVGKGKMDD